MCENDLWEQAKAFSKAVWSDALAAHDFEVGEHAAASQRALDIEAAIYAFLDLKANENEIINLLHKYFQLDSVSEINNHLLHARANYQIAQLREHCQKSGMTEGEFRHYEIHNRIREKLESNTKLLDLSAEKLKATIDKSDR